ncbi:hypothetical protein BGZ65_008281 [Modicella reniformis]|uniref:Required for respiratory growth protein 9, mitochondrial n=1 Tax=Modicella reniformis TaxID=1440133 RepID=A0A9P6IPG0_9FUNG|nr:hypothetical protein BGZ65_008281 [Modicella reniformis]
MQANRKLILSSGYRLSNKSRDHCRLGSFYISRLLRTSATSHFSSSIDTDRSSTDTAGETTNSNRVLKDAFSNPSVMQEAKERWALGEVDFAPIIFPKGRPQIAVLAKQLLETRISEGYSGHRTLKDERNTLRDQQATMVLDLRAKYSSPASSSLLSPPSSSSTLSLPATAENVASTPSPESHDNDNMPRQGMDEVRYLRKQFPDEWTAEKLAQHFNVASESIVRILKTNFQLSPERAAAQDMIKQQKRKMNVEAHIERIKTERHAIWLKDKAKNENAVQKNRSTTKRIKLGAPKRAIEVE